jgi:hypothetical protein
MKTLSREACSRWLKERAIVEEPYRNRELSPCFAAQISLPRAPLMRAAVARAVLASAAPFSVALLQFTDWLTEPSDQVAVLRAVRAAHGETAPLIDTPGHVFRAEEFDLMLGLVSLSMFYGWSSYLYIEGGPSFFWWEGDLLDVFAPDEAGLEEMEQAASRVLAGASWAERPQ